MPVQNREIARSLSEMADLLEIDGANVFRVRAYRDAASTIDSLPHRVADLIEEEEDLTQFAGIGEDLAAKIEEIAETGSFDELDEMRERVPSGLTDLLRIPGLGPKRVRMLHEELQINSLDDLEEAAKQEKIRTLQGFGEKTEAKIREGLQEAQAEQRIRLAEIEPVAESLVDYLQEDGAVTRIDVAGSYRRRRETVGDLDVLAVSKSGKSAVEHFVEYEDVEEVLDQGETRVRVRLRSDLQVDLRVVPAESHGAALLYFTGSQSHNVVLRKRCLERDLKLNEYGLFHGDERVAGETESEIYENLDLSFIPPELRENRGEIEAAEDDELPELICLDDIRGDLQSHSTASDGHADLSEMAEAAQQRGYEYLAITDHSPSVAVTGGLDADRLSQQIDEIDELNETFKGFRLLKSIEVDIRKDGSLDLPDEILKRLDLRMCSVHSYFDLPEEEQTERLLRAMDNSYFNILAHPTGRQIGKRKPIAVDMGRLLEGAKERGCFLEVNANPIRLDLNDVYCKMARDIGVKIAISTDAHRLSDLDYMRYGIGQARRGWLSSDDVLNTRNWDDLQPLLKRD